MKRFKKYITKKISRLLLILLVLVTIPTFLLTGTTKAQFPLLNPDEVRAVVLEMGMDSLSTVVLNDPAGLNIFIRTVDPIADPNTNPPTPAPPQSLVDFAAANGLTIPRAALLVLGKALFFDQQTGSDGNACASCHFKAGTDPRLTNTLNPGSRNTNPAEATLYNTTNSGATAGPNYTVIAADFPFHELADTLQTNYMEREVLFDTDDVMGSIGTFHATYSGSPVPDYTLPNATGTYDTAGPPVVDPVFNIGGVNTRSNGPRQAATHINGVFNFRLFWDGRADNNFNGLNMLGVKDLNAFMYWNAGGTLIRDLVGGTGDSALASQSVAPPDSAFSDEMAFAGRTMQDLGRKLLRLTATPETPLANIIPLGAQMVSPTDSVLGPFVNDPGTNGGRGINLTYQNLIQWAFLPLFWNGSGLGGAILLTPGGYHIMEENFAAFWGLSVQEYEIQLVSDQTPFDLFMNGDDNALDPTGGWASQQSQDIMRGLLTYINTEAAVLQQNPIMNNINFGACQLCHSGPELTENSLVNVPAKGFVTLDMTVKMDHNRELAIVAPASNFDVGFSNVGTRPNREDIGIGGTVLGNTPLSIARGGQMGFLWALLQLPAFVAKPNPMRGSNIDGSFKIPSLRNIELQGPYFHHGGVLTLKQAVEFYARHGDFADVNDPNIDVGLAMVTNVAHEDADLIVKFLIALTDERVRWEMAPFDHPQLFIPNGHPAGGGAHSILGPVYMADEILEYPAVGAAGRAELAPGPWPMGNSPLPNFLDISSTPVAGPNNDHFDQ